MIPTHQDYKDKRNSILIIEIRILKKVKIFIIGFKEEIFNIKLIKKELILNKNRIMINKYK